MCSSYGLGGALHPLPDDAVILDDKAVDAEVRAWMNDGSGGAKITGPRARNFNPIVRGLDHEVELAWWWLWLGGAKAKFSAFNSRDDMLVRRWRKHFQHRALLPANHYDEGGKVWALPGDEPFMIAAITAPREVDDDGPALSYSMVTRLGVGEASSVIAKTSGEPRMPLVIPASMWDEWLDPDVPGDAELVARVQLASEEISRAMTAGGTPDAEPSLF